MRRLTDDPRNANCQVYLFLWARPPFHLFDSVLHLSTLQPSYTHSDPLQCTFFHPNLIVTSYLTPNPYGLLFFFTIAPNKCMQKEEAWLVSAFSLHIDADHTGVLFQVGSWTHNGSPRWPREGYPIKAYPYFSTPIETTFPLLSREWSGQPYTWLTGWLSSPPIRVSPHLAWISRQNVSLAVVLERRALNFKFSYTFPLNGMRRQRRRKRERKERKKAWEMVSVEGWSLGPRGRESREGNKVCWGSHNFTPSLPLCAGDLC